MNQESKSSAGLFLAGAVLGGAIGAVLALLFAPQSGEETRKMIKEKATEAGKDFEEMKKEIGPKIEKAKNNLTKTFSGGETK
jgi:gas vesicle protein